MSHHTGISYSKYRWTRRNPVTGSSSERFGWRVRWKVGTEEGRRPQKEKGGFATKTMAETWVQRELLPALNAGYDSPSDMQKALVEQNEDKASKSRLAEMTIGSWSEQYAATYLIHLKARSKRHTISVLKTALKYWGDHKRVSSITSSMVTQFVETDTAFGTPPSADTKRNRLLNVRKMFEMAVKVGIIKYSPCEGLKLPKVGKGRTVYLTRAEIAMLLNACDTHKMPSAVGVSPASLKAFIAIAIYTGARLDEIFHLEWSDITDILVSGEKRITIQAKPKWDWTPKNGKPRTISLHPELVEILSNHCIDLDRRIDIARRHIIELENWARDKSNARPKVMERYGRPPGMKVLIRKAQSVHKTLSMMKQSSLIFPNINGNCLTATPKGFDAAVRRSGIKKQGAITPHVLRHTFASQLAMSGADLPSIQTLLAHVDIKTTMRYAHLAPDHTASAALKLPSFLSKK